MRCFCGFLRIREFSTSVTHIDFGVIFVLGLISGIALGLALRLSENKPMPERMTMRIAYVLGCAVNQPAV
jgi:hypothetical protein